jgi:hypothetical protein
LNYAGLLAPPSRESSLFRPEGGGVLCHGTKW